MDHLQAYKVRSTGACGCPPGACGCLHLPRNEVAGTSKDHLLPKFKEGGPDIIHPVTIDDAGLRAHCGAE
eukprot:6694112-Karenia_brevis.AAC.1